MEHIIERIIALQKQVHTLPEENMIQPSCLVFHLEKHAEFEQLGSYQLSLARQEFEEMKARTSGIDPFTGLQYDDTPLYYVALYAPAYVDIHQHHHSTSLIFIPFATWRYERTGVGYGNAGYERPWKAYLWTTYVEKHNCTTTFESLQRSSDAIKKDGLVAEGEADVYYEFYTFPVDYKVRMKLIDVPHKTFWDPVRDLEARQQTFRSDTE